MRFWPLLLLVAFLVGAAVYSEGMKTRAQVGQIAPDFTLQTLDGTTVSLSDFRGRPAIVYFWATWCPYCRHDAPAHRAFMERFGDQVTYLALNLREPADKVRAYREEFAARGIPLLRTELLDRHGRIYDLYRATGTPETWIIDAQGRAVRHLVGPSRFEDLVAAVEEAGISLWRRPGVGWIQAVTSWSAAAGDSRLWLGSEEGVFALTLEGWPGLEAPERRETALPLEPLDLPVKDVRSLSAAPDRPTLWIVARLEASSASQTAGSGSDAEAAAGERALVRWEDGRWEVYLQGDDPLAVAAGPRGRVYAWTRHRGLLVSLDEGQSWEALETPYRPQAAGVALAADPHQPGHLLSTGPGGLWQSRDGGRTWSRTEVEAVITAIAFHPHQRGEVWLTHEEGVLVSRDGGRTAEPLDGSPQRSLVGLAWWKHGQDPVPVVLATNGDFYAHHDGWRLAAVDAVGWASGPSGTESTAGAEGAPVSVEARMGAGETLSQDAGAEAEKPASAVTGPWVEGWDTGAGLEVGQVAPDFILPDLSGRWIRLSDLRGQRAVLINFWATWCPPCREEMPQFEALYRTRGHELAILAVNLRESSRQIEDFFKELDLTFPALLDVDGQVFRRYNIRPMPTSYFIDKQGVIRGRYFGYMPPQVLNGLVELALAG